MAGQLKLYSVTEEDLVFEVDTEELLEVVDRFLRFAALSVFQPNKRTDAAVAIFEEWLCYWYRLRAGIPLEPFQVASICGFNCTVNMVKVGKRSDRQIKYLIRVRPDL